MANCVALAKTAGHNEIAGGTFISLHVLPMLAVDALFLRTLQASRTRCCQSDKFTANA